MALESISKDFGRGLAKLFGTGSGRLRNILVELQGLKVTVVAGAAANTNIPITGITTKDTLVAVLQVEPDNGTTGTMLTDRTGEASITSAGNIRLSTTATTDKQLLVIWFDKE